MTNGGLHEVALRGYFTTTEKPLTSICVVGTLGDEATLVCGFGSGSLELWSAPFDPIDVAVARHSIMERGAHLGPITHVTSRAPAGRPETRQGVDAESVAAEWIRDDVTGRNVRSVRPMYDILLLTSSNDGSLLLWGVTSLGMTVGTGVQDRSRPPGKLVVLRRMSFSGSL